MPPARSAAAAAARSAGRAASRASARPAPAGRAASRASARPATAPRTPRAQPRPPRLASRRLTGPAPALRVRWERVGRYALVVVLLIVVGLYAQHALSYLSTRSQADAQSAAVRSLQRQNAALTREERSLSDPGTIVRDARALGMVRPGERPYVVQTPSGS